MRIWANRVSLLAIVVVLACGSVGLSQEAETTTDQITISDSPKTIDPASLMPEALAEKATVEFDGTSIREIADWLRANCSLPVLVDERSFVTAGLSLNETHTDRLNDQPLYLLLNRLHAARVHWYVEDDVLHLAAIDSDNGSPKMTTRPYNIGDLIDAGYDWDSIVDAVVSHMSPDSWDDVGGQGVQEILGDVMFIRNSDAVHVDVRGLLAALREHGRQTYVADPAQHIEIRSKLSENVTVSFDDMPLEEVIRDLAERSGIDIRLDSQSLREKRIRGREPVSLHLSDRSVKTVVSVIASELELRWVLRDGVLQVTTPEVAERVRKTAVYDVRDLCRNRSESDGLHDAIVSQAHPDSWDDVGGDGTLSFPKPGTMVVSTLEPIHDDVIALLTAYRTALKSSKRRDEYVDPDTEVLTYYYKLYTPMALSVERYIKQEIAPGTWQTAENTNAVGTIRMLESTPLTNEGSSAVVEQSVLVIRQTRPAHREISSLIEKVKNGQSYSEGSFGGGMGGMGGGFGGGMFDAKEKTPPRIQPNRN
ncbi:MAG: DUF4974 domain-containing protein [Planctomycetales bacterium]|nr:DUF4974 domain-containing protein [Planctomycetales bacterium]